MLGCVAKPVILVEKPYVAVLADDAVTTHCAGCVHSKYVLKRCADCQIMRYCSTECQKNDWQVHRIECTLLRNFAKKNRANVLPSMEVRVLTRLLIRTFYGDDRTMTAFNGRTFRHLMSHSGELKSAENLPRMTFMMTEVNDFLGWTGEDHFETAMVRSGALFNTVLAHYGRFFVNSFSILTDKKSVGCALYLGISELNHSCDPDLSYTFDGANIVLTAKTPDVVYNNKLTLSYYTLLKLNTTKRKESQAKHFFVCTCVVCEDENRDRWMRSLRCPSCPDGICPLNIEAPNIVCTTCLRIHPMGVQEALVKYDQLAKFNQLMHGDSPEEEDNVDLPPAEYLERSLTEYGRWCDVFSRFNVEMTRLAFRIAYYAATQQKFEVAEEFLARCKDPLRKYLPSNAALFDEVNRLTETIRNRGQGVKVDEGGDGATKISKYSDGDSVMQEVSDEEVFDVDVEESGGLYVDMPDLLKDGQEATVDKGTEERFSRLSVEVLRLYTTLFRMELESVIDPIVNGRDGSEMEGNRLYTVPDSPSSEKLIIKENNHCRKCTVQ